jgi:hypothetical protein
MNVEPVGTRDDKRTNGSLLNIIQSNGKSYLLRERSQTTLYAPCSRVTAQGCHASAPHLTLQKAPTTTARLLSHYTPPSRPPQRMRFATPPAAVASQPGVFRR